MRVLILLSFLMVMITPVLWAATLNDRLQEAQALLDSGNAPAALEVFREIQVDHPEETIALFGIGCAQYLQAVQQFELGEAETAQATLREARTSFHRLGEATEGTLSADAAFNSANCVALAAKRQQPPPDAPVKKEEYEKAIAACRGAVAAYEAVLRFHPDHAQSQQNRDHMRYLLKELLRNPPEEQPPPEGVAVFQQVGTALQDATAESQEGSNVVELIWQREDQS